MKELQRREFLGVVEAGAAWGATVAAAGEAAKNGPAAGAADVQTYASGREDGRMRDLTIS
jgi:hypothetical protein